jgi:ABC-type nitrate/sulfonate/bicarbonate transport system permease component
VRRAAHGFLAALRRAGVFLGLPLALLAGWFVLSEGSTDPLAPSLRSILEAFGETWLDGDRLVADVVPSLVRLTAGYAVATASGVALGVAIGLLPTLRALLEPTLEFLRAVPPVVLVPVIGIVAGLGSDTSRVAVIAVGCVWPILLNTVEGVRAVDPVLRDTARSYGIPVSRRLVHLTLRSASPQIVTGMRQSLAIAIILMVISEISAASNGLGFTIVQFQRTFAIDRMWSGVFVLGIVGVVVALGFRVFDRVILHWYHGQRAVQRGG